MENTKKLSESILKDLKKLLPDPQSFLSELLIVSLQRAIQEEVQEKTGDPFERGKAFSRWGSNPGSVQTEQGKMKISVPRLLDKQTGKTTEPEIYKSINRSVTIPEETFRVMVSSLAQGDFKKLSKDIVERFGVSQPVMSRKFQKCAQEATEELMNRDLGNYRFLAIAIDGKYFAKEQILHAVGITEQGDKMSLGFIQSTTENAEAVKGMLKLFIERNLYTDEGILFLCDGSKGIRRAIEEVFGEKALIQRCQWHKRENVLSYLNEQYRKIYKRRIDEAYADTVYESARSKLKQIAVDLERVNVSAAHSMLEGLEETLTIHRLGLREELGKSLTTTNVIENFNSQLKKRTHNVKRWRPGQMRRNWMGIALLEIEKNCKRIHNASKLYLLKHALAVVTNSNIIHTA